MIKLVLRSAMVLTILTGLIISCNSPKTPDRNSDTAENEAGHYGAKISVENAISGEKLMSLLNEKDSVWVTMSSKIISNCQKAGCWMDLDVGNNQVIKVTFKDYAFVIPIDSEGKTATVEGYARKEYVSVELRKHYAEDEGKSQEEIDAITEPETNFMFDAIGVIITE
jgi:hypothetical protein